MTVSTVEFVTVVAEHDGIIGRFFFLPQWWQSMSALLVKFYAMMAAEHDGIIGCCFATVVAEHDSIIGQIFCYKDGRA